jgi:superfamily II DNA or RNA helicase
VTRALPSWFDAAVVARARELVAASHVHLVKPPPWPVVARVRDAVVTVHAGLDQDPGRGECSCAAEEDCEHVAATLLAAFAAMDGDRAAHVEAARQDQVASWLAELGRVDARDAAPAAKSGGPDERVIAYVLDGASPGDVGLRVLQCARRGGELIPGAVLGAMGDPQRGPPRWAGVDDLRRIAMLRAVARVAPQTTRLRVDRVPGELLRDLAASGHLFWANPRSAALAWGEPRASALGWQPVPPDGYRLGVPAPLVIVPAREPHYVDPDAGVIGALDLGVPAELVERIASGPAVPAGMRATVERSLAAMLAPEAPSAPQAVTPDLAATDEPLRLVLAAGLDRSGRDGPRLRLAGEAWYGDERFDLAVWDAARPHRRDLVAEGRADERLRQLLARLPHGDRVATSLELLADARYVVGAVAPALRADGWTCRFTDDFPADTPLTDVTFVEHLRGLPDRRDWFALQLGVRVGGRTVPLLPILLEAIRDRRLSLDSAGGVDVRLPEGELVHVPADRVQRWLLPLGELELSGVARNGALTIPVAVAAAIADGLDHREVPQLVAARARLDALLALAPRQEPPSFRGELRPYQRYGLAWLHALHDAGLGGVLGDEMGLGKTVQVLAFLAGARPARALVVAPRSVVGTWRAEAARFAPELGATVHLGASRATEAGELGGGLILTSYQTLVRDLAVFQEVAWDSVILDEAQAFKNPSTRLRHAVASLSATSRFAITGTPIENHLGELWSIADAVVPGLLGRRASFDAVFRRPVERHGATVPLDGLRRRIRPFLLRRTKDQVERDLPAKTEIVERIELDGAQRDLYESLRVRLDRRVRDAIASRGEYTPSIAILDALLKLRQCACDPRLIALPEAKRVDGSAKLERLLAMLEELTANGRTVLVFSQFATMLGLIEAACAEAAIATLSLTGDTRDRDAVIGRFQAGEAPVFLISLKAGGVGLNLTRADTVIHYDPWWNPAVEAQATDRAHRIGQTRPVLVYKLVAAGTVEESILELQDDKRDLTTAALRDGGVTHLAASDLEDLFRRVI